MQAYDLKTSDPQAVEIAGSFDVNGAGAVSNVEGSGFTVAYLATPGEWVVTFNELWAHMLSAVAEFQIAVAEDTFAQVGTYTAANRTLVLHLWNITAGAIANQAGRINFRAVMSNAR